MEVSLAPEAAQTTEMRSSAIQVHFLNCPASIYSLYHVNAFMIAVVLSRWHFPTERSVVLIVEARVGRNSSNKT